MIMRSSSNFKERRALARRLDKSATWKSPLLEAKRAKSLRIVR
jgi:hypothetical protein